MTTTRASTAARTVPLVLAGLLRGAGVLLLGASAVLGIQAWWSRFSVCYVPGEPPVDGLPADRVGACGALQDHKYDYDVPEEPWVPIADAARLEGLSLIALGLGVALICLSLGGRRLVRVLSVAGGTALAVMWVGMGVPVWRMGVTAVPAGFDGWLAAGSVGILTLLTTPVLAVVTWFHGARDARRAAGFWLALTFAQPLPEFVATMFLAGSHDSSPLSGAFRCAMVAVAAVAMLVASVPFRSRASLQERL